MHRYEDREGAVPHDATSAVPAPRDHDDAADQPAHPTRAVPLGGLRDLAGAATSRLAPPPRDGGTRAIPVRAAAGADGGDAPRDLEDGPAHDDDHQPTTALRQAPHPSAPVIREVGGYRLVERLGSGGMGTVYESLDADGRAVALKLIHPHVAADPAARRRLAREVSLLHKIKGDGVARVLDAEVDGAEAFVVTELIEGPTLEEDVEAHGPFEPDELSGLAHGLADALAAIHAAGVVHRDLKPSNVMLSPSGPVLIDFGIAQVADDVRLTQTGMVTGTPGYLDPEVIAGAEPGPECDWWAWAAVLLFAATGRPPFGHGTMATVLQRVAGGHAQTDGAEEAVGDALRSALDPHPGRRLGHESVLDVLDGKWSTQDVAEATQFLAAAPLDDGDDEDGTRLLGAGGPRPAGAPPRTSILPGGVAAASAATTLTPAGGPPTHAGPPATGTPTTVVRGRGGADDPSYEPVHAPVYPPAARYGTPPDPGAASARGAGRGPGEDPTPGAGATRVSPAGYGTPGAFRDPVTAGHRGGAASAYTDRDEGDGAGHTRVAPLGAAGGPPFATAPGEAAYRANAATVAPARPYAPPPGSGPNGSSVQSPYAAASSAPLGPPGAGGQGMAPYATPDGAGGGGMVPPRHVGAPALVAPDGTRLPVPAWLREPPHRTVTVGLLWLVTAPLAAAAPGWYLAVATVLLILLGAAGWSGRARRLTRRKMGLRRGDAARSLLRLPWDLVLSVGGLLLGALFGAGVGILAYYVIEGLAAAQPFAAHLTAGVSAALAVAAAWLTPTSYSQRLGAREVLETLTPGRGARAAVVGLATLVGAAVVVGIGAGSIGAPQWAPLAPPPELGSLLVPPA